MSSKIKYNPPHQPNKYYNREATNQEAVIQRNLLNSKDLKSVEIEKLCSEESALFLVNDTYLKLASKGERDEALDIAAKVIANHGAEIKDELKNNGLEENSLPQENLANQNQSQPQSQETQAPQGNSLADAIAKISGGTLSEIIAKITEIMAGRSGADLQNGAENLGAVFEVLNGTELLDKAVGEFLVQDPVLVADIKNVLGNAKSGLEAFDNVIDRNFTAQQKDAVNNVTPEQLGDRRKANIQEQKEKTDNKVKESGNFLG